MAFARDGSGGEYHLLEDGSIGYYSSEGEAGRLAESMDDLFSLIVSCICWHDCCDAKEYADSKILEEYGQRQRNINLEDMDMDSWRRVADALGVPTDEMCIRDRDINGHLISQHRDEKDWFPYTLTFRRVLAYFSCELDTYKNMAGTEYIACLLYTSRCV